MKYDLDRFIKKQKEDYFKALNEIKNGKKVTHWIWYIFPQLDGLGNSEYSSFYGIKSLDEAKEYMKNDYLRNNLINICEELYKLNDSIRNIFGYPDYLKVKSCMTLFNLAYPENIIFKKIIDKFYNGEFDSKTILFLK